MDKQSINLIVVYKNMNRHDIFEINYEDEFDSLFIYVLNKRLKLKNSLIIVEKSGSPIINNKGELELLIYDISENPVKYHTRSTNTMDIITEVDEINHY